MDRDSKEDGRINSNEQPGEGSSKGKDKQRSLTTRIWDSTTMAAETMTTPTIQNLQSISSSSATKGQSSSAGGSRSIGGPSDTEALDILSRRNISTPAQAPGSSFRSVPQEHHSASHAFDDFTTGDRVQSLSGDNWLSIDVQRAELADGSAVADLLSQPGLEDAMMPTKEELNDDMSPETAASLRQALFGTESSVQSSLWDSVLNFKPKFVTNSDAYATDAQMHLGPVAKHDVASIWYQQWDQVLSNYNNEVWGDLAPLVSEAREEVKVLVADGKERQPGQADALGRLRMVLAHLRGGWS